MFSPRPMKHVLIQVLTEELPQVSLTLADLALFSPDQRSLYDDHFPLIPGEHFREIYTQASSRLQKISRHIQLAPLLHLNQLQVISEEELDKTNRWLGEVWERCSEFEENFHRIENEKQMISQLEQALENFGELNIDLGLLQGERLFLDIHVGMVPRANVSQLKEAVTLANYLLFDYMEHEESIHVIVIGPKGERERELRSVLDTAGFRALSIPPEFQDEPERVRVKLERRKLELGQRLQHKIEEKRSCANELREQLERSRNILILAEPYVRIDTAARSAGYLSIISGWIPARESRHIQTALEQALSTPFRFDTRNPRADERHLVPSYMPDNRLMAPFATLVKQYGIPRYGEVDPTAIFAITFILMFGMMFGDIGHGLTIALVALLARKKLKTFTLFVVSIGISATLFGLLYGSIFGYEHLIEALWIAPLSDPLYMLSVALSWGVAFLVLINLISIYNRFVQGDIARAVFDANGLVSAVLYLSVLYGLYQIHLNGEYGNSTAVISILSLLALLVYKLIKAQASPGERMLVAFIETFETLTGYVSNTLSFLRVAAFSLNHVALAIAVFALADMMESIQTHIVMVVCGNLFILVLEGAIVTIQALRLEYYEGFSRFYSGDGLEFRPLRLNTGDSA
ncbi:MAG: V-type ATP synthase subunit I [Gammaproteobacteria bacterium]|nr:V-type ATP synthase subunit I [Gammaproteobacteria bacterium]